MKKGILLMFIFSLFLNPLYGQEFGYPVRGEPWYFIHMDLEISEDQGEGPWEVTEVRVNEERIKDFLLFQDKEEIYDQVIPETGHFTLKVRCDWEESKTYSVNINLENPKTGKASVLKTEMQAPSQKGYWNSGWKNYLSLIVKEEHGIERENFPVHATVGVLSHYLNSPDEVRVVKAIKKGKKIDYVELPCQVYDMVRWKDEKLLKAEEKDEETGQVITRYHPTATFSLAFMVDLDPNEEATYVVFYNNPSTSEPEIKTSLKVSGEGLGKTIENSFYRVELDPKSGMIFKVLEKETDILLEHKLETNGAVHWNPGVYSPPHAWIHCSDWEEPDFSEIKGSLFYSLRRSAPLPHLKNVFVNINYYFYADSPLILMESVMQVKEDMYVKALRNGEIVFNKQVFKETAYKTISGKTEVIDFAHTRMHPEHVVVLRPDTPWVSFLNSEKKIAFASLFLDYATSCMQGGGASQQQPYIYVQHGPWYYMSRAFVYSFGSNNQTRMLPVKKGSQYYARTGWLPFSFDQNKEHSKILDEYYRMYKHPLWIHEVIETYPESPDAWLEPILTEPFDEGVKDSVGGKKKR